MQGLNLRLQACKACTLPTELIAQNVSMYIKCQYECQAIFFISPKHPLRDCFCSQPSFMRRGTNRARPQHVVAVLGWGHISDSCASVRLFYTLLGKKQLPICLCRFATATNYSLFEYFIVCTIGIIVQNVMGITAQRNATTELLKLMKNARNPVKRRNMPHLVIIALPYSLMSYQFC